MAEATSLDAVASLLKLFTGDSKTRTQTGGSVTESQSTQSSLSDEDLAGLLRTALESNQGLASVTQGQKAAGLFNSTSNKLLTNDLLARLTAQAAQQGASKTTTSTRTATPIVTRDANGGSDIMRKGALALTAYQKLLKPAMESQMGKKVLGAAEGTGTDILGAITGAFAGAGAAPDAFNTAGAANWDQALSVPNSDIMQTFSDSISGVSDALAPMFADSAASFSDPLMQSFSTQDIASGADAASNAGAVEDTTNFPTASGTSSASSSSGSPSASEVLSEANATTVAGSLSGSLSSSATGLGTATEGISYGASTPSSLGSLDTGYDLGSGLSEAGGSTDALAGSAGAGEAASSWGGNILGYVGPIMSALSAENNPKGAQDKDYRHAVGSAVLNYFGYGWAAPIVHEVAEPLLNASMGAGVESLGTFGAVMADPVGAPLSGQFEIGDLVTSTLDPANIFGGNEGGSSGALVAASLDPIGAMLGDTGANQFIRDTIDNNPISDALGKVICTELTMQDKLSPDLYAVSVSPKYIMKGRILDGYHVWGVSFVSALRKSEKLSTWIAPYVSAYIEHKSGIRPNWQGFWIKNIMHPICWMLSFFSRDKKAYMKLYRRTRKEA